MTTHPKIQEARRKLDLLLAGAIDDVAWRWQIADRYLEWLTTDAGWPIPTDDTPPAAAPAKQQGTPPTKEYLAARQALRGHE